jgi:uncharacterized protein YjbI with pentapeptide repeats
VGLFNIFGRPKPKPVPAVIIRNRIGEEIDHVEGWDLCGKNLRNRNWCHAELSEQILDGADLSGSNLLGANLQGASLRNCILVNCEISYADVSGCDFSGADMDGCLLYRSETQRARFENVRATERSDIPGCKIVVSQPSHGVELI